MSTDLIRLLVAVIAGGIFGWTLSRLPDKWVYVVMAVGAALVLVLVSK